MRPVYWILLVIAGVFAAILLPTSITINGTDPTIYDISDARYLQVVEDVLAPNNRHFASKNFTVESTQYVEDFVAVVKTTNAHEQVSVTFVFELYNDRLYLTNYTVGEFSESDFNSTELGRYIIAAGRQ